MFYSVLAGIIPLSLRNGGGHLILFVPLVYKWGQHCPLCPPATAQPPYDVAAVRAAADLGAELTRGT